MTATATESLGIEHIIRAHSGESYIRRVLPYPSHTGESEGIVVTFTEVTQLRASEELVRTIAENSTQAMVMMMVMMMMIDERGHVTYCNQVLLDMTGYDSEEIRSATLHDLIHHRYPDGRPYPIGECPIDRALPKDFSVRTHEDVFFRKDGTTFEVSCAASPIIKDGIPVSTVIEVRDITPQNAARRELANREAHPRCVIDNIVGLVGVLDTDGILLEANQAALVGGGVNRDEVIGRPFWDWVWWSYDPVIRQQLQDAFRKALTGAGSCVMTRSCGWLAIRG